MERAKQPKTLDLPPAIATRSEVAECGARQIARALVLSALGERLGEIEGGNRNEITVFHFAGHDQCRLERAFGNFEVASVEGDPAMVVQRDRFATPVPRLAEVRVRLREGALRVAQLALLRQNGPEILQDHAAQPGLVGGSEQSFECRRSRSEVSATHENIRFGDDCLALYRLLPDSPSDFLRSPRQLESPIPLGARSMDVGEPRERARLLRSIVALRGERITRLGPLEQPKSFRRNTLVDEFVGVRHVRCTFGSARALLFAR